MPNSGRALQSATAFKDAVLQATVTATDATCPWTTVTTEGAAEIVNSGIGVWAKTGVSPSKKRMRAAVWLICRGINLQLRNPNYFPGWGTLANEQPAVDCRFYFPQC